jgi:hypothetical protein
VSKDYGVESPSAMDAWTRTYFKITDGETTDAYLIRTGVTADTPSGFVKRMNMALAWLWPQLTPRTRPLYDEIRGIVEDYHNKTTNFRTFIEGQPLSLSAEPTESDASKCEKAMFLFEQAKELHRVEATLAAQEAFKQSQSARASKPRKLNEDECKRIARVYWESKREGTGYGVAKMLAAEYGVSATTIHTTANKYKPLN